MATPATPWVGTAVWSGALIVNGIGTERDEPRTARSVVAPADETVRLARPSAPVTALAPPAVSVTPAAGRGVDVPGAPVVLNSVTATVNGAPAVAVDGTLLTTSGNTVGLKFASEVSTSISSSSPGPRRSLHRPLPYLLSTH